MIKQIDAALTLVFAELSEASLYHAPEAKAGQNILDAKQKTQDGLSELRSSLKRVCDSLYPQ